MAKGPGGLSDGGEMAYDNSSRVEPKRSQQWFIDGTEPELLPNKKQAVEVPNHTSFSGLLNSNISPWGNASSFQSVAGQFTERLFDLETARTVNFDDRDNPSVGIGSMNLGRKVIEDPFGSDSTFGLSISHSLEDPRSGLNYGGIRKVKVSQVKDSENFMSGSVGHGYVRDDNTMSASHAYRKAGDTSVPMGLSFNKGDENVISVSETFNRADGNFISMGQSYDTGDNSHISMGQTYKDDNTDISMGYSFVKDENNVMTMRETFTKDKDTISMSHTFKDSNGDVPVSQPFSKVDSSIISMGQTFNKGSDNTISIGHTYNNVDDNTMSIGRTCNKMDDNDLSMRHCLSKGESTIISFGGLNDDDDSNPSGRLICSYDLLMGQSSVRSSEELNEKGLLDSNADALANAAQMTNPGDSFSKKKVEQKANKKAPPNNFPSNVRSLLSTGMLDGVPVKYVAWSREVNYSCHEFVFTE